MKIKLHFVINSLQGGGAERVLSSLATFFYKQGHDISIICLNYARPAYEIPEGIKVKYLLKNRRQGLFYRGYYAGYTFKKLISILKEEKPACIISFMTSANLWVGLAAKVTKIPYIVSERINPDHIEAFNYLQRWFLRSIYSQAKSVVAPCRGVETALLQTKALKGLGNTKVIINPVKKLGQVSDELIHTNNYVLAVGRLDRQKGFDILIDAFSKLKSKELDLLIVGEGSERELLQKQINDLGLQDKIKLVGAKSQVQNYYHQAEIFVLSSRNEGYPNVLLEALSMGCPSIAMDCEYGPSEIIIHEENGLLVREQSADALSENIERLLTDLPLKQKISNNAKLINTTNSVEEVFAKWQALVYNSVQ